MPVSQSSRNSSISMATGLYSCHSSSQCTCASSRADQNGITSLLGYFSELVKAQPSGPSKPQAQPFCRLSTINRSRFSAQSSLNGVIVFPSQAIASIARSEEHTSELQSRGHLVCRLLLEKKKYTLLCVFKRLTP